MSDLESPSSASSTSSDEESGQQPAEQQGPPALVPQEEPPEENTALEDQVDGGMREAQAGDQRAVYLWTWPHTNRTGRAKPCDYTKADFATAVVEAYVHTGKTWEQWLCVEEAHPLSKSALEQEFHKHLVIQTTGQCRWLEQADYLRTHKNIYASVSTASNRNSYWAGIAYLVCPSAKKSKDDLDPEPLMSPGHDTFPAQLQARREGTRRISPSEQYDTVVKQGLTTVTKLFAYAARQHAAGDKSWLTLCVRQGEKKVRELISISHAISTAEVTLHHSSMTHFQVLQEAATAPCICQGRAVPAWQQILSLNHVNEAGYCNALYNTFKAGGGKGLNHLYIGTANTGKTALTRPLLALFGERAFVKPQVGTTFALEGLIGSKAIIWNDFRWPHPPLAWGDLLNVLDNEAFKIGVPKTEGQKDHGGKGWYGIGCRSTLL